MKNLYLYLNLGSILLPLLFTFHPKLKFYKQWRYLFPAILVMMLIFISWDIVFTETGIWGFNDDYLIGIFLFGLPLEEWLFFVCIPYACIFTHHSLRILKPKLVVPKRWMQISYVSVLTLLIVVLWFKFDKWYTLVNFLYCIILLGVVYNWRSRLLSEFIPGFIVILIPFFAVNGILTGTGIADSVVWYNDLENLSIRIGTIPVEDIIYALSMLLTVLAISTYLESRHNPQN